MRFSPPASLLALTTAAAIPHLRGPPNLPAPVTSLFSPLLPPPTLLSLIFLHPHPTPLLFPYYQFDFIIAVASGVVSSTQQRRLIVIESVSACGTIL